MRHRLTYLFVADHLVRVLFAVSLLRRVLFARNASFTFRSSAQDAFFAAFDMQIFKRSLQLSRQACCMLSNLPDWRRIDSTGLSLVSTGSILLSLFSPRVCVRRFFQTNMRIDSIFINIRQAGRIVTHGFVDMVIPARTARRKNNEAFEGLQVGVGFFKLFIKDKKPSRLESVLEWQLFRVNSHGKAHLKKSRRNG